MQEHLFWTFCYSEHGSSNINKTDSSTLLKGENYCKTTLRIIAKLGRNFCTKSLSYCWKYLTVSYDPFHFCIIFGTIISLFFIIISIMVIIIYYHHYNHYYGITVVYLIIVVIYCVKSVQIRSFSCLYFLHSDWIRKFTP